MVLTRAASTAACLFAHRASAFISPYGKLLAQSPSWRRQATMLQPQSQPQQQQRQQQQQQRMQPLQSGGESSESTTTAGAAASAAPAKGSSSTATNTDVFAFDFDGVICNSQGESSRSGLKAVKRLWPDVASKLLEAEGGDGSEEGKDAPAWILDKMRELRPIVETGYENILLVRLLIEEKLGQPTPFASDKLLEMWGPDARDVLTLRYGVGRNKLVEAFGQARDSWIETDFDGWLGANSFYEGVPEALSACKGELYVVTTKQQRFASALLDHAGIRVPLDRLFGLGTGPKADVLAGLLAKHSDSTIHFFEDRVETLEVVCADSRLEKGIEMYLCDWGFNTPAQRARGKSNPRVRVIGTSDVAGVLALE